MKTEGNPGRRGWGSYLCRVATFVSLLLLLLLPPQGAARAASASVEIFSPQGEAKAVRQVAARFSEEMTSLGDPRLDDPFAVECPVRGKGRWADGKNWVYDFDRDLEAGVKCTFIVKSGLKTLAGNDIAGQKSFSFNTSGPQVVSVHPQEDSSPIDEDQVFLLTVDGDVREESLPRHLSCYLGETREQVGIRIVKGEEKEAIIKSAGYSPRGSAKMLAVQCGRPLPANFSVDLVWGKGVLSKSGMPSTAAQVFHYKTREPFTAAVHCERLKARGDCIPLLPVSIRFTAPIPSALAKAISMKGGSKIYRPYLDPEEEGEGYVHRVTFKGLFRENASFVVTMPAKLKDDAGRPLANLTAFPATVKTGPYPPLAKFSSRFGIIEKSDPVLPLTVRNIEPRLLGRLREVPAEQDLMDKAKGITSGLIMKADDLAKKVLPADKKDSLTNLSASIRPVEGDLEIIDWLQRVSSVGRSRSLLKGERKARGLTMPKPLGAKTFEVIGIPFKKTGLYVVELESDILGAALLAKQKPVYVHTAALVTNLSAHFKRGKESSLVWVTTLDAAAPVEGANVSIRDCRGKVYWEGETGKNGIAFIGKPLPDPEKTPYAEIKRDDDAYYDDSQIEPVSSMNSGLFVFARTKDDMTFVHSSWDRGIEPYRFKLPAGRIQQDLIVHTIFDKPLFRAGETVHMKHLVRKPTKDGLIFSSKLPSSLVIQHLGSDQKYTVPLVWNGAAGSSETAWTIPKETRLGRYRVILDGKDQQYDSGGFRVEEFKVPLMKGSIKPLSDPLIDVDKATLDLMVEYLSGGGAKDLPVRLRAQTMPRHVRFDEYEHFTFSNGQVLEGISTRNEIDDMEEPGDLEDEEEQPSRPVRAVAGQKVLAASAVTLGPGGLARTTIDGIPRSPVPLDMMTEMEFRDPNGRVVTISRTIPLFPSRALIGIDAELSTSFNDPLKFKVAVLDLSGAPLAGRPVRIDLFLRKYYSHRKRLVGGFYAYETTREIKKVFAAACTGTTAGDGLLLCEVRPPVSGQLIIEARTTDDAGHVSVAYQDAWVAGKDDQWFDASSSDRIDIIPDKRKYEPGETALFQVRMPMREATALVTIEREGVLEGFVTNLSGKEPVLRVPIKATYAPNMFVSVLCVRGRTGGTKPTAFIDLGKPTFKLGIAGVSIGWQAHELKVTVAPDKTRYRPRDRASFHVKVKTADGTPLPKGAEVAFAVVDDGLLELLPNRSWDVLEQMMQKREYAVLTSTAQMQVVGRRHYGQKALPFGGGGGRQITRELFDTLLLWKGRLVLNEKGEALVEAPLNDAITSFTAVAVATAGKDRFGTGRTHIRTSQDLMILAGLPEMVREGDKFKATFTIRNTTDRPLDTEATGRIIDGKGPVDLPLRKEMLDAGQAKVVEWDMVAPAGSETLKWEVMVRDKAGAAQDALRTTQRIARQVPVRVVQATIAQAEQPLRFDVEKPRDGLPERGGVRVALKPRLSDDVSGVIDYMSLYPYTCMEQRVSRAVALQDREMWQSIVRELPSYMDRDGLAKYFPLMNEGSDVLTAYLLSITHEAGWDIPTPLRSRLVEGLRKFVEGRLARTSPLPRADLTVRKLAAIEALARSGGASPTLLDSIDVQPNLWPTSSVLDWMSILTRVKDIPERKKKLADAEQVVRSLLNFQGTRMGFSTEKGDYLWWLMVNGDVNAIRTVLTLLNEPAWKEDMPRLLRGVIERQREGRWLTTVANAWGRLALKKFSEAFEKADVTGITTATFKKEKRTSDWGESPSGKTMLLGWQAGKDSLTVSHAGAGKPWVIVQSLAAIPLKEPFSSGYKIKKSYEAVDRRNSGAWSTGDVVRVRLDIEAQAEMTWVVVSDPIPAGAAILGTGLGRDSGILTADEKAEGRVWPAFEERSFEAFRAYYRYVPQGKWTIEYTLRLSTPGIFVLPETRVEALYSPEMFGEIPNGPFSIK